MNGSDTYSYKGWLVSDKLYKRAFAVWGHFVVFQLLIAVVAIFFGILLGISGVLFR